MARRQTRFPPPGGSHPAGTSGGRDDSRGSGTKPTSRQVPAPLVEPCVCVPGHCRVPTALCSASQCPWADPLAPRPPGTTVYQAPPWSHWEEQGGACSLWDTPLRLSTAQVPTPAPPGLTSSHKPVDTYSARWRWESLALQSSSTWWRASLGQASFREPRPRSWGSPGAGATTPRPWDVAPPGAELQRALFSEKQSRDESAMSLCPLEPLPSWALHPPTTPTSPRHLKDPIFPRQTLVGGRVSHTPRSSPGAGTISLPGGR